MPSAILICRWDDCRVRYASIGERPPVCPTCGRVGRWRIVPRLEVPVEVVWSQSDRQLLRVLRIAAD